MLVNWIALTAVAAFSAVAPSPAPQAPLKWESDYGKALEQARSDDRPLLVVLDVPGDEAQRLEPSLIDPSSGKFPLEKYDLCHVDVSTEYGEQVAEAFNADSFPHVTIIDRSGSVILHKQSGTISEEAWNDALAKHERGLRRGEGTYRVSKPAVEETEGDSVATPTVRYGEPVQMHYTKPYCPSCQRR